MAPLDSKLAELDRILASLEGGALVAFSGGTDSALLLAEAGRVLGSRCTAVTADSPSIPRAELEEAVRFAADRGLAHRVVATEELQDPRYAANTEDRCYFCKGALFGTLARLAAETGHRWILYGAVADDLGDFRPGMRAAQEAGARAPLLEAGFTKADVRARSKALGLPTWDKPAAACLASRLPTGTPITAQALGRVERAEALLKSRGFRQCRVRVLGDAARIEVELSELTRLTEPVLRAEVTTSLREFGFRFVTLDLEGFRSGSLSPRPKEAPLGVHRID